MNDMENIRPLAKARKISVVQEIRGVSLTRTAESVLFSAAEISSEGIVSSDQKEYAGSMMITIDLNKVEAAGATPQLASHLRRHAEHSIGVGVRLLRLARAEAERRVAPQLVRAMTTHSSFRANGQKLLIDVDVNCQLAQAGGSEEEARRSQG